jgi:hypothetical protein
MPMFKWDHLFKVNATPVGEYGAEELLVVGPDRAKRLVGGWNHFMQRLGGPLFRIVDAVGKPLYPPVLITEADMVGVKVVPFNRVGPPIVSLVELEPDEPHVVDS